MIVEMEQISSKVVVSLVEKNQLVSLSELLQNCVIEICIAIQLQWDIQEVGTK